MHTHIYGCNYAQAFLCPKMLIHACIYLPPTLEKARQAGGTMRCEATIWCVFTCVCEREGEREKEGEREGENEGER